LSALGVHGRPSRSTATGPSRKYRRPSVPVSRAIFGNAGVGWLSTTGLPFLWHRSDLFCAADPIDIRACDARRRSGRVRGGDHGGSGTRTAGPEKVTSGATGRHLPETRRSWPVGAVTTRGPAPRAARPRRGGRRHVRGERTTQCPSSPALRCCFAGDVGPSLPHLSRRAQLESRQTGNPAVPHRRSWERLRPRPRYFFPRPDHSAGAAHSGPGEKSARFVSGRRDGAAGRSAGRVEEFIHAPVAMAVNRAGTRRSEWASSPR
jgi:hypothetical protein